MTILSAAAKTVLALTGAPALAGILLDIPIQIPKSEWFSLLLLLGEKFCVQDPSPELRFITLSGSLTFLSPRVGNS